MNVQLREWKMTDAHDLACALNNKKIHDNLRDGLPFPYTSSDAEMYISAMLNAEKDSQYAWAIAVDNKAIGSIGAFRKENIHRLTAEIGYYIAEPFWGKGIGTSALKNACSHIFEHTDILRIFAEPFSYNRASCRILEKAGFTFEGTLRMNAIKNGRVLDMNMYAMVKQQ
ncbi:MAG TPA: GNAT family protein [Chitinispirillaceae bacterium]|nr:GNAT family protein [Chitinispirillaceae bacterium]